MRRVKGIRKAYIKLWEFPKDLSEFFSLAGSVSTLILDVPHATTEQFRLFYEAQHPSIPKKVLHLRDLFIYSVAGVKDLLEPGFMTYFAAHSSYQALNLEPHYRNLDIYTFPLFLRIPTKTKSVDFKVLKRSQAHFMCGCKFCI